MRFVVLLCMGACARTLPASDTAVDTQEVEPLVEPVVESEPEPAPIVAPALSARELIEAAGVATFVEDRELLVAAIDVDAMERWFVRPPRGVFVYSERAVEVAEPQVTVRGRCRRVPRWDSNVLNELAVVVWQQGAYRTVLHLGQESVAVADETRERGEWRTAGIRRLPVRAIAWDDAHIRYAEGAEIHEVACVPALRTVSCGDAQLLGPRGYCVDQELVVRPWRAPTVPHVGGIIPAYHDSMPDVPAGDCDVQCEPSPCEEALRMQLIPRAPLYAEEAPVLAAFGTQAACRAFASARESREADGEGVW